MKIFKIAINALVVSLVGIICGIATTGMLLLMLFVSEKFSNLLLNSKLSAYVKDIDFYIIIYAPAFFFVLMFNYIEFGNIKFRIIKYFQGSILRKILLYFSALVVIFAVLLSWVLINDMLYSKYRIFAAELADEMENTVRKKENILSIANKENIDSILMVP
jgi:hypothetical protein